MFVFIELQLNQNYHLVSATMQLSSTPPFQFNYAELEHLKRIYPDTVYFEIFIVENQPTNPKVSDLCQTAEDE